MKPKDFKFYLLFLYQHPTWRGRREAKRVEKVSLFFWECQVYISYQEWSTGSPKNIATWDIYNLGVIAQSKNSNYWIQNKMTIIGFYFSHSLIRINFWLFLTLSPTYISSSLVGSEIFQSSTTNKKPSHYHITCVVSYCIHFNMVKLKTLIYTCFLVSIKDKKSSIY